MGVTFIGNPFDQETEYDDSDWEMNAVEEWIMPPQEIAFDDGGRATIDVILAPEEDSSESFADEDSDEDYNPDDDNEDNYEFDNEAQEFDSYFYDSNEDDDDEDIDYVTYPLPAEPASEPDKSAVNDNANPSEDSDTD